MSTRGNAPHNSLATHSLDRSSDKRKDEEWVRVQLSAPHTRVHVVWQGRIPTLGHRSASVEARLVPAGLQPTFLGVIDGRSHFAVDLSDVDRHSVEALLPADAHLTTLREAAGVLDPDEANLLAFASGIAVWHARTRHCGSCGAEVQVKESGHMRECPGCNAQHFPRTDPAVIMLVTDGDRCVLGRQRGWPAGFFSTLAGFVEPGESLEDAVIREVREEVGLEVSDVRYHSSQPWPFPQSVMLGFHARAVAGDVVPNPNELEDAQWFSAEDLRGGFPRMPPPITIARTLMDAWLRDL